MEQSESRSNLHAICMSGFQLFENKKQEYDSALTMSNKAS